MRLTVPLVVCGIPKRYYSRKMIFRSQRPDEVLEDSYFIKDGADEIYVPVQIRCVYEDASFKHLFGIRHVGRWECGLTLPTTGQVVGGEQVTLSPENLKAVEAEFEKEKDFYPHRAYEESEKNFR